MARRLCGYSHRVVVLPPAIRLNLGPLRDQQDAPTVRAIDCVSPHPSLPLSEQVGFDDVTRHAEITRHRAP